MNKALRSMALDCCAVGLNLGVGACALFSGHYLGAAILTAIAAIAGRDAWTSARVVQRVDQ